MATDSTVDQLPTLVQSKTHTDLLDIIDRLRSQRLDKYVDLPQICVVGEQSSGKSSVLSALSGIRFPTKDNLCTAHPTEVVCRRSSVETASVRIIPHSQRQTPLGAFEHANVDFNNFADLVDEAKDAMGIGNGSKAFAFDTLQVKITGPDQPNLTLVDLPGLFVAGNRQQTVEDAQNVKNLVHSYMKNPRSIILAIITAKTDFNNQIISEYAKEYDPTGERTLAIITKPDTLHAGSDTEKAFIKLVANDDVRFHGWHVLKNRDFDTRDSSDEERDESERRFFADRAWNHIDPSHLGIAALKPRLSTLLSNRILQELPKVVKVIQHGINGCNKILSNLGPERGTTRDMRLHLVKIAENYTSLAKSAVDGTYLGEFFGSALDDDGYSKRLRAKVQNILADFADRMAHAGHTQEIVTTTSVHDTSHPLQVTHEQYLDKVLDLMSRNRGCELPGTYNPRIIGDLFHEQSKPWQEIVRQCTAQILHFARRTCDEIITYTADKETASNIKRVLIGPAIDRIRIDLEMTSLELLQPSISLHPITYNQYLTENIQKAKIAHQKAILTKRLDRFFGTHIAAGRVELKGCNINVQDLLDSLVQENNIQDTQTFAAEEATSCMQAYYKVAIKTLVDDFSVLAVEHKLMLALPEMLSSSQIAYLDDDVVRQISEENEFSKRSRAETKAKLAVLDSCLKLLNSFGFFHDDLVDSGTQTEEKGSNKPNGGATGPSPDSSETSSGLNLANQASGARQRPVSRQSDVSHPSTPAPPQHYLPQQHAYQATPFKEQPGGLLSGQHISFMPEYKHQSPEEVRLSAAASTNEPPPSADPFSVSSLADALPGTRTTNTTSPERAAASAPSIFDTSGGAAKKSMFGAKSGASTSGGLFGAKSAAPASGGLFGAQPSTPASGGLFGAQPTTPANSVSKHAVPSLVLGGSTGGSGFGGSNDGGGFRFGSSASSSATSASSASSGGSDSVASVFGFPRPAPAANGGLSANGSPAPTLFGKK